MENAFCSRRPIRASLGIGLALMAVVALAGCGNDLESANESTTTTGELGSTTSSAETGDGDSAESDSGGATGITLPDGTEITMPEGVDLTLPDGADLTVPDGLGDCVEAGAALAELNLALLGSRSTTDIDDAADTLKEAFGPEFDDDVDTLADAARAAAEAGTISPSALSEDDHTKASDALTDRLGEVCGQS
ncbi:MAG: hypothetical protein R2754_11235 [Microthrixaceae bacterium]